MEGDDGSSIGRALERLEIAEVVHLHHLEMFAFAELEAAETVTGTFGLEQGLGDDETQPPVVFHVIIQAGVSEQHRQVLLAAAEPGRLSA